MIKKDILKEINIYHKFTIFSPLHPYLRDIYMHEKSELMKLFIKEVIYKHKDIHLFMEEQYISESTFYRLKNQLILKLYCLLILDKKVSKEEILRDI